LGLEKSIAEANILADKLTLQMENFGENLQRELSPTLSHYLYRHKG
jgi:hypothetical protein